MNELYLKSTLAFGGSTLNKNKVYKLFTEHWKDYVCSEHTSALDIKAVKKIVI